MYIEPIFFEGEERDGFYVQPMMKRVWAAQLEVLKEIEGVCKRHNLTYFADCGSLLGAIRHKGFIPWDDDMDIAMHRTDLKKFLYYAEREFPKNYSIRHVHNRDRYGNLLVRILNCDNNLTNIEYMHRFHGCPYIIGMDIFIYDDIPLSEEDFELQLQMLIATNALAHCWEKEDVALEEKMELLHQVEEVTGFTFDHEEKKTFRQQLLSLSDHVCSMYENKNAKEVTIMVKQANGMKKFRFPKEYISKTITVPFECTTIEVPVKYDEILKLRYGDYSEKKRYTTHNYPFYRGQEEVLLEEMEKQGLPIPDYFIDKKFDDDNKEEEK